MIEIFGELVLFYSKLFLVTFAEIAALYVIAATLYRVMDRVRKRGKGLQQTKDRIRFYELRHDRERVDFCEYGIEGAKKRAAASQHTEGKDEPTRKAAGLFPGAATQRGVQ